MTTYTAHAFEAAFDRVFDSDPEFLRFFKTAGCYLDDLSHVPVDGMPSKERERVLTASVPALARRIRRYDPEVVIVVLKKIEGHVREALRRARIDAPTYVLPFPGQGHQAVYRRRLSRILKQHLRAA